MENQMLYKKTNWFTAFTVSLLLSACGGGNGDSKQNGSSNPSAGGSNGGVPIQSGIRLSKKTRYTKGLQDEDIVTETTFKYDSENRLSIETTLVTYYDANGKEIVLNGNPKLIMTYEYDPNDHIKKITLNSYNRSNEIENIGINEFIYHGDVLYKSSHSHTSISDPDVNSSGFSTHENYVGFYATKITGKSFNHNHTKISESTTVRKVNNNRIVSDDIDSIQLVSGDHSKSHITYTYDEKKGIKTSKGLYKTFDAGSTTPKSIYRTDYTYNYNLHSDKVDPYCYRGKLPKNSRATLALMQFPACHLLTSLTSKSSTSSSNGETIQKQNLTYKFDDKNLVIEDKMMIEPSDQPYFSRSFEYENY